MAYTFVGLDHVQLAAPEGCESEARAFYHQLLGWPEILKPVPLRQRGGVWFQCGMHEVHVGVQKDFAPATKAHPAFQVRHIEALRSHLLGNNIQVIEDSARENEGIKRFYVHDPYGNRLEFIEV